MSLISTFLEEKEYDHLKDYLTQYNTELPEYIYYTGNPTLDAILNHFMARAKAEQIDIVCHNLHFPEHTTLKDTDLTIIFGNCIENAMEASLSVEAKNRYIGITSNIQGNFIVFVFENAYTGNPEKDRNTGLFLSSKRGKKKSGIGLLSIKHIVEEYHGDIDISFDENKFKVKILLQYINQP